MIQLWNRFFFSECSPLPMALVRIIVALVFLCQISLIRSEFNVWYGADSEAIVSMESAMRCLPNTPCFSLLTITEPDAAILSGFQLLALCSGSFLLIGWHSRISAFVCFLVMQSLMRRDPFVVGGESELLSQILFYLALSNSGMLLSFERFLRLRKRCPLPGIALPWAQRLLQIQICVVYIQTFFAKIAHTEWLDGTAVYRVLQTKELVNFPLPDFIRGNEGLGHFLTWSALGFEAILPVILWITPLKHWAILIAIFFHLIMEYCLNIPFFQFLMIAGLISFCDPALLVSVADRILVRYGTKVQVVKDKPEDESDGKSDVEPIHKSEDMPENKSEDKLENNP